MGLYEKYIGADKLPEFQLLLSLIRRDASEKSPNESLSLMEGGKIDWGFVLHLTDRHRVLPVFYSNVKKEGLQACLPEFARNRLSRQYFEILGYNLRLRQKLTEVLTIWERRNIPAVPFKGPVLSFLIYGDSSLRYCQDMDVLVPEHCVIPARDALMEAGFSSPMEPLFGKQFEQIIKCGRECDFLDRTGQFRLDLHWRLGGPFRRPFDYEFCRKRLRTIRFHDRNVFVLSPEDTLLHLCVNGSYDIWNSLEQVLCIAELIDRHPALDWETVQKLADALHCKRMLLAGLFLARDVFETSLPPEIAGRIERDKVVETVAENIYLRLLRGANPKSHVEKRLAEIPYYLKIREDFPDKVLYLFRRVFVPTSKDWQNRVFDTRFSSFYFLSRPLDLMVELREAFKNWASKPQS